MSTTALPMAVHPDPAGAATPVEFARRLQALMRAYRRSLDSVARRSRDAGTPIDASGQMADGTHVDSVVTLRAAILKRRDVFVRTMTEKLMTYAIGRGMTYHDMPVIRDILRKSAAQDYRFSTIVLGIVNSPPFQMRVKTGS